MKSILNRETILYLIFGVATTLVNYLVFLLLYNHGNGVLANVAAFAVAVAFAFVVNKLFVFESKSWSLDTLKKEVPGFLGARIGSFLIEEAALILTERVFHLGGVVVLTVLGYSFDWVVIIKLALSVIVVILNYIFCKFFIFKKSEKRD